MIIRVNQSLYVEMTLDEAVKFIEQEEIFCNKKIELYTSSINKIKAHIAFVLLSLTLV